MNNPSEADRRLATSRRNEIVRQASATLATIGAFAFVDLVLSPLYGVALAWPASAGLVITAVVATGLAFWGLRFIDHRV